MRRLSQVHGRTDPPVQTLLERTMVLGGLAGFAIAELTLLALTVVGLFSSSDPGPWYGDLFLNLLWAQPVGLIGGLLGGVEALLALTAILLLGPLRRSTLLASLVAGVAAAVGPLWLNYRDGWPRADGSLVGIGFTCIAFLTAALLTWPVLTGRPWLPPGLARPSGIG